MGFITAATPAAARSKGSTLVGQFDTDGDGTVDLAEAKKAASDLFDRLDTDKKVPSASRDCAAA
jgi:hypothetical protein